jgi:hypothetical protein
MSDYAVTIELPDHKRGDRWPGVPVGGPVIIDGVQPANSLTRIRWHFVHRGSNTVYRMDSDATQSPDASITIGNAVTWSWSIAEVEEFLQRGGQWDWDAEFYEAGKDTPLTLYKGVLTVNADTTKTVS